ncbi:MAG: PEP-CTERM sorting domain-containing protein [Singulisphaera sp.]
MGTQGCKWLARLGAGLIMLALAGPRAEADAIRSTTRYTVTDLGDVPGGVHYTPGALNNAGQAVGDYHTATDIGAFYYADGVMRPRAMSAKALNDAGETPMAPGDRAINNRGETAGSRDFAWSPEPRATLTTAGETIVIHPAGAVTSIALGLNDHGQAVGNHRHPDGTSTPFLYGDGATIDLGPAGPSPGSTAAYDINNLGQVVGIHIWDGGAEGFLYEDGRYQLLGTLPGGTSGGSMAVAINDLGQVVGHSSSALGSRAFLYEGGVMLDLNDLTPPDAGWILHDAVDINDKGQILVKGGRNTGGSRALLLTPDPVPVPEPTALMTLAALGLGLAWRRHQRRTRTHAVRR